MTTLPANGSTGTCAYALSGMVTTTRSPRSAAPSVVSAEARSPRSATTSTSVSGPRELLSTTSYPLVMASLATACPTLPAPMKPMVVMRSQTSRPAALFRDGDPLGVLRGAGALAVGGVLVVHDQGV